MSAPAEGTDNRMDLTELVNYCQCHVCSDSYCLRKECRNGHDTGRKISRFGYPQDARPTPTIAENAKGQLTFFPARIKCDKDTNKYIPILLALWRANIDASPIVTEEVLIRYIGKYATKAEGQSEALIVEQHGIMNMMGLVTC